MCAFLTLFWKLSGEQANVYYVCYVISNLPESYIKKMFIGKSSKLVAFIRKLIYICPHGIWHGSIFYDIYIYTQLFMENVYMYINRKSIEDIYIDLFNSIFASWFIQNMCSFFNPSKWGFFIVESLSFLCNYKHFDSI